MPARPSYIRWETNAHEPSPVAVIVRLVLSGEKEHVPALSSLQTSVCTSPSSGSTSVWGAQSAEVLPTLMPPNSAVSAPISGA